MDISVNQAEYSNTPAGPVVHLFGRELDGTLHEVRVTDFRPYFWVREREADRPHPKNVTVSEERSVSLKGEPLRKLYTEKPTDVRSVRENYHHYEADIPFASRFLIDMGITGGISFPADICSYTDIKPAVVASKSRVCTCDIECEVTEGLSDPEHEKITAITCHDSFTGRYTTIYLKGAAPLPDERTPLQNGCFNPDVHTIITCETEKELMQQFITYLKETDPDILTGWNFVDFDAAYILTRAKILGFPQDVFARIPGPTERNAMRGRVIFDLLAGYKKMQGSQKESFRLDAVAQEELGENKVYHAESFNELWNDYPAKFIEYNFKDVELCVKINQKISIVEFFQEVARYVGCPLDKTLNSSNVVDIFVLRRAHGRFVLPSKGEQNKSEEFEGATVFSPSKGVCENVIVLDLKSLYPMAMMTLNASQETKSPDGEIHAPNGVRFKKSPDGLTRDIISELLNERDNKKKLRNTFPYGSEEYNLYDMQQNVIKVIMNSYYGVSGFSRFRLYDVEIGSAVTSVGRAIIAHTKKIITGHGYEVIYGDTDSCFVQLPKVSLEETMQIARGLEAELNASYSGFSLETLGADKNFFSIKFEKIYKRFFQGGIKKRYAGHLIWKEGQDVDKIDIAGLESKRSDSSQMTREALGTILEMILKGGGKPEVKEYLSEVLKDYRAGRCPLEKAGIPGGLNKSLDDYEHLDAHGRGAEYANKYFGTTFARGSKPKRLYIKNSFDVEHYPKTDVICFEYPEQIPAGVFEIDWDTMCEKTLKTPITRVFESLGWDWDEFDPKGAKKTTLDMFF
ncbi:MAG TPA: DNA-directed DNA polymerase [Methanocorpusculum sp.]|nr:DNA-directed DNA polymerase [Methanocorpusculum sp.]